MSAREDLSPEANEARRKFWEMCASREPVAQKVTIEGSVTQRHVLHNETSQDVALWADRMLEEWDKRWIAGAEEE